MDAFLRLAELGGHAHLSPTSCLLCVTSCIAGAHLQHRAGTYQTLLWSSLRARSLLLTLLPKQKDPSVLQHCRQLSALLATTGLASTPDVRKLQMEVCRTCDTQQAFMVYFTLTVSYCTVHSEKSLPPTPLLSFNLGV